MADSQPAIGKRIRVIEAPIKSSNKKEVSTKRDPIDYRMSSKEIIRVIRLSSFTMNPKIPTIIIKKDKNILNINILF